MPSVVQPQLITLAHSSTTFCNLEYSLQSLSKSSTLRIKRAFELIHPYLKSAFESKSKGISIVLETWVTEDQFLTSSKSKNLEEELINPAFQIPDDSPFKFSVGSIDLKKVLPLKNGLLCGKLIFCKIATGRSFCCTEEAKTTILPEGYHSFFIDKNLDKQDPLSISFCNIDSIPSKIDYLINDKQLILPLYLVDVEWDPQVERRSRQVLLCDNCEKNESVMYCQADAAHLCPKCDEIIHSQKLTSKHSRVPLDKGLHCIINCRIHPERFAEFFCPTCHSLVCLSCKMIGNHSQGEHATHSLVSVPDAYSSIISASNNPDPIIDEGRRSIIRQLDKIHSKSQLILQNGSQIREQLKQAYQGALNSLDEQIFKKLLVLRSDASLYGRLLKAIDHSSEYLTYLKTGRDAPQFLLSWHHYLQAKVASSITPSSNLSPILKSNDPSLSPDIMLELKGSFSIQPAAPLNLSTITVNSGFSSSSKMKQMDTSETTVNGSKSIKTLFSHH